MKKKIFLATLLLVCVTVFYSCESNDSPSTNTPLPNENIPSLLSPGNNSTISTLEPTFDWTDLTSALSYQLQVSGNISFGSLWLDTSGLTVSQFNSSANFLNDSSSYYWRVRAVTVNDTTQWSTVFNFATLVESINPTNKVLLEMFTNTSCIPCVEANQYLDEILELHGITNNDANVVMLRIHTTLYPNDPFYLYNTIDNNARMAYYPNSAIINPRTFLLGTFMGNFSQSAWTNKINEKIAETRPFAIKLTNTYDTVSRTGNINVKIKQVIGGGISDLVYHIAISENEIPYNAPNGENHFNNTLRDLITGPDGQAFTIGSGQTNTYDWNYSISSAINQNETELVVFVQQVPTKAVMAVENVSLK